MEIRYKAAMAVSWPICTAALCMANPHAALMEHPNHAPTTAGIDSTNCVNEVFDANTGGINGGVVYANL